jgi:hypothetical protein
MVSIPEELLRESDVEAKRRSVRRSALSATAAWRELARSDPDVVVEAIAHSEQRCFHAGRSEAVDLVRQNREFRR